MELRQLRYLVTLAQELHFGRAAARLMIAQPTLSQEIGKLERELGVRLFDRGPRGVHVTPAGTAVLGPARAALAAAAELANVAAAAARAGTGTLRLGFVPATAPALLPAVVRRFRAAQPGTALELVEYGIEEPAAGLRDGAVDVALLWPPVDVPDLRSRTLAVEPRVAVLPAGHPLAGAAELCIDDLAGEPFVRVDTADRVAADFWLAVDQRTVPVRPGPASRSVDGLFALVAAGAGVGLAPAVVSGRAPAGTLAFVRVRDIPPARVAVAWRTAPLPPPAAAFVRTCLETAAARAGPAGL